MLFKEPFVRKHSLIKDKKFLMKETFLNSFKRKETVLNLNLPLLELLGISLPLMKSNFRLSEV